VQDDWTRTEKRGGARVLVAGSINMDIAARVERLPAPGETVGGHDLKFVPGGKGANQAVAAARGGAHASLIGCVGDDAFGASLRQFLAGQHVDVSGVAVRPGTPTGTALILVDAAGENVVIVIAAANATLDRDLVARATIGPGDILVAQFETPLESTRALFSAGKSSAATTVLNPAPAAVLDPELLALVDVLVVNETELAVVTGLPASPTPSADEVRSSAQELRARGFDGALVATLGARGAIAIAGDVTVEIAGRAVTAVDTTGAGDCFVGYLASGLAAGDELPAALATANVAASLCVQRPGAGPSMPAIGEVRAVE